MATLHQGLTAAEDVRAHVNAQSNPVEWNLSIAVEAILTEQLSQKRKLDGIEQLLRYLQSQ